MATFWLVFSVNAKASLIDPFISMSEEVVTQTISNFVATQYLQPG